MTTPTDHQPSGVLLHDAIVDQLAYLLAGRSTRGDLVGGIAAVIFDAPTDPLRKWRDVTGRVDLYARLTSVSIGRREALPRCIPPDGLGGGEQRRFALIAGRAAGDLW